MFVDRHCTDIIVILIRCWPLAWSSRLLGGRDYITECTANCHI